MSGDDTQRDMKYLFVARHGQYLNDDRLSDTGKKQMKVLAESMKPILGDGNHTQILSSSAERAYESAEILAEELNVDVLQKFAFLWAGSDSEWKENKYGDSEKIHELVTERRSISDALILVSHLEVTEDYPAFFNVIEYEDSEMWGGIPKGEAVYLDLAKREWTRLPDDRLIYKVGQGHVY